MNRPVLAAAFVSVAALAGCAPGGIKAPEDKGVCYHAVFLKDETIKFNKLAEGVPNLETCAARLESMRLRFRMLGSQAETTVGSYQGQYIFLKREGVLTSTSLTGARYVALVRSGDGRLVVPGAMPPEQK